MKSFSQWLPRSNYKSWKQLTLQTDILAGLSVATLLIPQALAYAELGDMSPSAGAIAALVAPLGFLALGGSRCLSVGPIAILALLAAEAQRNLGVLPDGVSAGPMLAMSAGMIMFLIGALRLGFIINFVSEPVLTGFVTAAAVLIGVSQLAPLLGMSVESDSGLHHSISALIAHVNDIRPIDAGIGIGCLVLLLARRRLGAMISYAPLGFIVSKALPLVLVLGGAVITFMLGGIDPAVLPTTVGSVRVDLGIGLPPMDPDLWVKILPDAAAIAILALVIARGVQLSTARSASDRYPVDFHGVSVGSANVFSGVLSGMPSGVSLSRSALLSELQAASPAAPTIAGLIAGGGLLLASDTLQFLPQAILAAIIMSALPGIVEPARIKRAFRFHKGDAAAMVITFLLVLFLGIRAGLMAGAITSLGYYLYRTSRPRVVRIAKADGDKTNFRSIERSDVDSEDGDWMVAVRIDEDLYFGNSEYCDNEIRQHLGDRICQAVVLDMRSVGTMDSTAVGMLIQLKDDLAGRGIELRLSTVNRLLKAKLRLAGLMSEVSEEGKLYESVTQAVEEDRIDRPDNSSSQKE